MLRLEFRSLHNHARLRHSYPMPRDYMLKRDRDAWMSTSMHQLLSAVVGMAILVRSSGQVICQPMFAQCGGPRWRGSTCCQEGSTCVARSQWYSQCLEGAAPVQYISASPFFRNIECCANPVLARQILITTTPISNNLFCDITNDLMCTGAGMDKVGQMQYPYNTLQHIHASRALELSEPSEKVQTCVMELSNNRSQACDFCNLSGLWCKAR